MTGIKLTGAAAPVITHLARLGFAAKGIVTILIGALALRFALGLGGGITGPRGAIGVLYNEPFGRTNLALLATGLAGYALWMFVEAILDPDRKGASFQGLAERVAFFVTGWSRADGFSASFQQGSSCTGSTSSCSCVTALCKSARVCPLACCESEGRPLWTRWLGCAHYAGAGSTTYRWKRNTWRLTSRRALSSL